MPLTRMSTRPKASSVCWIASSAAALSAMSPAMTSASPPAFSTALRASASRSSERPMIATFAPTAGQGAAGPDADPAGAARHDGDAVGRG